MNQLIGQREIANSVVVFMPIEIILIASKGLSQAMAIIEHRRNTIETKAIKAELLEPIFAV